MDFDATLSLNITANPPAAPAAARGGGVNVERKGDDAAAAPKVKYRNKYEKRRAKSAKAKQDNAAVAGKLQTTASGKPQKKEEEEEEGVNDNGSDEEDIAPPLHHHHAASAAAAVVTPAGINIEAEEEEEEEESATSSWLEGVKAAGNDNDAKKRVLPAAAAAAARNPPPKTAIAPRAAAVVASTERSSKKARMKEEGHEIEKEVVVDVPVSPYPSKTSADQTAAAAAAAARREKEDTAERAAYLAEFHARPLELDRRAGAVVGQGRQRPYETSVPSSHLFAKANRWEDLPLHARLIAAVQSASGFNLAQPTAIQSQAIPAFNATTTPAASASRAHKNADNHHPSSNRNNTNLFLHSETGSGKTLAYLLPILQSLAVDDAEHGDSIQSPSPSSQQQQQQQAEGDPHRRRSDFGTRCLILCPTRELASQTAAAAEKLCSAAFRRIVPGCLMGESGRKSEKARIRKGLAIVVATPGRLLDHLARTEALLLSLKGKLRWLVLDEADRLLDMGLGDQVRQIIQRIRANQSGSGVNGITWRSVLVSATVTDQVQALAKETLLGRGIDNVAEWVLVKGGSDSSISSSSSSSSHAKNVTVGETSTATASSELADSTPRQLIQLHVTVSAKLRLTALLSFLVERAHKGEKTVVFVSTCAAADYYHALLSAVDCILPLSTGDTTKATTVQEKSIFGSRCPIFKLHGSVPHGERQLVLRKFTKDEDADGKKRGSILLATDVAARGLNLPSVDWIVQYDPPGDVSDYVHRAGRVARAGRAGHSLLFLLPSEQDFLTVLKHRGVKTMSAISLASTLNTAAGICSSLADLGFVRSGGGRLMGKGKANSRSGEAFCSELQHRLEDCVVQDDLHAKTAAKQTREKRKGGGKRDEAVFGELLELARKAFLSYIRAYPTKEKLIRHIFAAKALHLGHVARSFALKEPPKKLAATKKRTAETTDSTAEEPRKRQALAFGLEKNKECTANPTKRVKSGGQKRKASTDDHRDASFNPGKARALLMTNAMKLQNNGLDSL